jgi:hypothetical protein
METIAHSFNFAHGPRNALSAATNANTIVPVRQTQQAYLSMSNEEGSRMQSFFTLTTPLNRIDLTHLTLTINHHTAMEWCTKAKLKEMLGERSIYAKCVTLHLDERDLGDMKWKPVGQINTDWLQHILSGPNTVPVQQLKLELHVAIDREVITQLSDQARMEALVVLQPSQREKVPRSHNSGPNHRNNAGRPVYLLRGLDKPCDRCSRGARDQGLEPNAHRAPAQSVYQDTNASWRQTLTNPEREKEASTSEGRKGAAAQGGGQRSQSKEAKDGRPALARPDQEVGRQRKSDDFGQWQSVSVSLFLVRFRSINRRHRSAGSEE